jgi:hypothetical protein
VTKRPEDRERSLPLSRRASSSGSRTGAFMGRKAWNAPVSPQVTGLHVGAGRDCKRVRILLLICAPGRIRTCAHGSGGRCSIP